MPSASNWVQLNGTSVNVGTTLTITATQTSQNITANTSVITLTYTIASGISWGVFNTPANTYMTPTIDGVEGTRTKVTNPASLNAGQSAVVLTTTHTVNHNSDGTKTVGISVFYDDRPGGGATTKTVSTFYLTLDTIPRASSLSVTASQTMGTSYRFTISRASSSFRHKITYAFGNTSGTVLDTTTSDVTTKDWTPPTTLASQSVVTGGSKSATITYYLYTYNGGSQIGSVSATATLSIPSADSLSSVTASQTMGTAYTFTCTRNAENYTHKLNWSFGSASGTDNTAFTTSKSFTPATSLGSQIPSSNSGTIYYSITTYNGSTVVGTSSTKSATLSIPSGAEPTFSFSATVTNGNSLGVAIVGYSTVAWSTTGVSTKYGATVASYSFSFAGVSSTDGTKSGVKLISGSAGGTSYTPTMTVTDSRGKKTTHTASAVTVYTYAQPVIVSSYAYRSDENGTRKDDGIYITAKINAKTDYTCGGKNSISVQSRWKLSTGSWSGWTNRTNNTEFITSEFAFDKSYQFELRVVDSLGGEKSFSNTIPTAFVTEVSKAGGKAVGFFGYPQEDGFLEVYAPARFPIWGGKSVPNGTDLNTITDSGRYFSISSSYRHPSSKVEGAWEMIVFSCLANRTDNKTTWSYGEQWQRGNQDHTWWRRTMSTNGGTTPIFGAWARCYVDGENPIVGNNSSVIGSIISSSGNITASAKDTSYTTCNIILPKGSWIADAKVGVLDGRRIGFNAQITMPTSTHTWDMQDYRVIQSFDQGYKVLQFVRLLETTQSQEMCIKVMFGSETASFPFTAQCRLKFSRIR